MKKTALLFPGQGSQYIGMGQEFIESDSGARTIMDMAEQVSGFSLRQLCFEGPMQDLTRVLHLQPALTVINLICLQQFTRILPECTPVYVGGHSLGEYSALHASGVLSAEDTLRLVTRRGELMEREGAANPGGMRAVLGLTIKEVDDLLDQYAGDGTVVVANYNTAQQVILSGDAEGLDGVADLCREQGAKVIPLKVTVANHSPLVAGAVEDFSSFMETIAFNEPGIPIFFNATAATEQNPAAIRSIMARQIASRVRWYESVNRMVEGGVEVFVELGPGIVLTGMMKKILPRKGAVTCVQADSPESMEKVAALIME